MKSSFITSNTQKLALKLALKLSESTQSSSKAIARDLLKLAQTSCSGSRQATKVRTVKHCTTNQFFTKSYDYSNEASLLVPTSHE